MYIHLWSRQKQVLKQQKVYKSRLSGQVDEIETVGHYIFGVSLESAHVEIQRVHALERGLIFFCILPENYRFSSFHWIKKRVLHDLKGASWAIVSISYSFSAKRAISTSSTYQRQHTNMKASLLNKARFILYFSRK